MASPEAIGTASCMCGEKVYVAKNAGGFPYYRCPACGVEVRHHRHSSAGKFIREKVAIFQTEPPAVAPVATPEKPVKHEPTPAAKPAPKSVVSSLLLG